MLQDWEEVNATWLNPQGNRGASILTGVTPDDIEAAAIPDARVPDPGRAGLVEIPLNVDTVQGWANGSLENFGWSIVSDAGSLWAFNSSEAFLIGTFTVVGGHHVGNEAADRNLLARAGIAVMRLQRLVQRALVEQSDTHAVNPFRAPARPPPR
jgi:hypothetical protein